VTGTTEDTRCYVDGVSLDGRCGTCAFFVRYYVEGAEVQVGDCRVWKAQKAETATCSSHKAVGTSWDGWNRRTTAARTPRRPSDERGGAPRTAPLPREIGLDMDLDEFRRVLREVLREELGVSQVAMADRFRGGQLVLKPGREGTQEKSVPLDVFFHKIVMVRDKLRLLEQKVNASALPEDEKVQLQQYITACYGSLTTFNVLFRDDEDRFKGQGARD
jgi:hypothetical protein